MHDTVLPMAFNSRPKVTFADKGQVEDNAEVEFTFGKTEEGETEDSSKQNSEKWPPMPDSSSTTLSTAKGE